MQCKMENTIFIPCKQKLFRFKSPSLKVKETTIKASDNWNGNSVPEFKDCFSFMPLYFGGTASKLQFIKNFRISMHTLVLTNYRYYSIAMATVNSMNLEK